MGRHVDKVWLLLGREAEIPKPGDWQMEEVGPEEILMVRQKDDTVKAFYNVCQHRGNPLVEEKKGHVCADSFASTTAGLFYRMAN